MSHQAHAKDPHNKSQAVQQRPASSPLVHSGISFEDFLKHAFSVSDSEMEKLRKVVADYNTHETEEYKAQETLLVKAAFERETDMYKPYAAMGNMILDRAVQDAPEGSLPAIQLLACDKPIPGYFAEREPDILLIPKKDGDTPISLENLRWQHVLWTFEFKVDHQAVIGKRQRETAETGSDMVSSDICSASSATSTYYTDSNSKKATPPDIQLANYLAEVMSDGGDRSHVFGAIIEGTKMRLQFYSRSCGVLSDEIDIVEDSIMHAVFLVLVSRQDFKGLGFNTAMGHCNPFNTNDATTMRSDLDFSPIPKGGHGFEPDSPFRTSLQKRVHTEYCLVGRGTAVYEVERPAKCEVDIVAKLAWQVKTRRPEVEAILIAREVNPKHAPEIYGTLTVQDTGPTKALISACTKRGQFEDRELRILLMRKYTPVSKVTTDREFVVVMVHILYFSHELYSKRGLLHRDIGIFNIAFYLDEKGGIVGVLIDFDLATYPLPDGNPEPTSQHRSGTKPFMAIETLDAESGEPYTHHFVHEMESILYTSVWHGVGYRGAVFPYRKREFDYLASWRKGTWKNVRDMKRSFLTGYHEILSHIHPGILLKFCTKLAAVIKSRYLVLEARKDWETETSEQSLDGGSSDLPIELYDKSKPLVVSDEPPMPSKALLPTFLFNMQFAGPSWPCSRDCCQDTDPDISVVT